MAQPTNREEFKEWCLRALGKPILEINVTNEQVEDRIDESLSYYFDYHFDGTQKSFLKHEVTQQNKDDGYITIPENIIGVVNVFNVNGFFLNQPISSSGLHSVFNHLVGLESTDLINTYLTKQHLEFIEEIIAGAPLIRYNRHVNKLHIDVDWRKLPVGTKIIAEVFEIVDPNVFTDVWKDRWLQNYAKAKIQMQWGHNLLKFEQLQLPGGAIFNGSRIFDEAKEEIRRLEDEMIESFSLPAMDMIG